MTLTKWYKMRNKIVLLSLIVSCALLTGCEKQETSNPDIVTYEGNEYVFLEYPENEFYYDYNGNAHDTFDEVDGIYPVDSPKWEIIWNGGDLCCIKDKADEANNYYADDENYDWYVGIDTEEELEFYPVNITDSECEAIYGFEEMEKATSVFMEEFDVHGSIIKISKDGIVRGTISIVKYDGNWYWKSEVIDESREKDGTWPEYVQPLPETLDRKVKEVE